MNTPPYYHYPASTKYSNASNATPVGPDPNRCACGWALPCVSISATGKYHVPYESGHNGGVQQIITCPYCKERLISNDQGKNWEVLIESA